ncbi:MAG: NAD(P)/FAD-dependent oxidoreductase [Solirubrobacteraceae bacterium]|nr:NAD(P)/FAD-dependent oxidoreductase [Solirubrobacteraceae bacterium]
MPVRATKRGAERTPLDIDCDVLICGASFAGLTVARELAAATGPDGRRPDVVVVDRYEIGERQTSACAAPLPWLDAMGIADAVRQTFPTVEARTPRGRFSWRLPQPFATFDYRLLCELLAAQGDFRFETAKVDGRQAIDPADAHRPADDPADRDRITVLTDRGPIRAPLVVDALGWRRVLAPSDEAEIQPPDAFLSRGLEVHPSGTGDAFELFLDRRYAPSGYGWSFPAGDEVRVGVGSFDPHHHVKDPTLQLAADVGREPHGYQGNWIPHRLRPATGDGVFFVGDSAGHCLPLSAEGIRPALFFGLALGRELRMVVEGRQTREQALRRYAAVSARHEPAYTWLLRLQRSVGVIVPRERLARRVLSGLSRDGLAERAWGRYLRLMPATSV